MDGQLLYLIASSSQAGYQQKARQPRQPDTSKIFRTCARASWSAECQISIRGHYLVSPYPVKTKDLFGAYLARGFRGNGPYLREFETE